MSFGDDIDRDLDEIDGELDKIRRATALVLLGYAIVCLVLCGLGAWLLSAVVSWLGRH